MTIRYLGVVLHRIQREDLELLRQWRNHPDIVRNMEFREHISNEMQRSWFRTINNPSNYYFIIYRKDQAIGMIHLSAIDRIQKTAQVGLFIASAEHLKTHLPVMASLGLLRFAFEKLQLQSVVAKVKYENREAIEYNDRLGFTYNGSSSNRAFGRYLLNVEAFRFHAGKLLAIAQRLYPDQSSLLISYDPELGIDRLLKRQIEQVGQKSFVKST